MVLDTNTAERLWNRDSTTPGVWDAYQVFLKDKEEWKKYFFMCFDDEKTEKYNDVIQECVINLIRNFWILNRFTKYGSSEWDFLDPLARHFTICYNTKNYFQPCTTWIPFPRQIPKCKIYPSQNVGILECVRCGAVCEKNTFDQAIWHIDHGVGITNGRPCPNDGTNAMFWNGLAVGPDRKEPKETPKSDVIKPKKDARPSPKKP